MCVVTGLVAKMVKCTPIRNAWVGGAKPPTIQHQREREREREREKERERDRKRERERDPPIRFSTSGARTHFKSSGLGCFFRTPH